MCRGAYNASNLFNIHGNFWNGRRVLWQGDNCSFCAMRHKIWRTYLDRCDLIPAQFSARPFQIVTARVCKLNGSWFADLCYTGIFYRLTTPPTQGVLGSPYFARKVTCTGVLHAAGEVYKSYSFTSYVDGFARRKSKIVAWKASEEAAGNERDGGMTYATTANNANELAPHILSGGNLSLPSAERTQCWRRTMVTKSNRWHVIASLRRWHCVIVCCISKRHYIYCAPYSAM